MVSVLLLLLLLVSEDLHRMLWGLLLLHDCSDHVACAARDST
jgi:hypothetical protein